jgi:hypothetical protein
VFGSKAPRGEHEMSDFKKRSDEFNEQLGKLLGKSRGNTKGTTIAALILVLFIGMIAALKNSQNDNRELTPEYFACVSDYMDWYSARPVSTSELRSQALNVCHRQFERLGRPIWQEKKQVTR